jgi:hypothetical protein
MAITQVANPSSVPSAVADYEAQNAHISAFNNIVNNQPFILTNSGGTGLPAIKLGTYIQYGGNLYVVDTSDYAITGTPVDGNNYIRLSGTTTLTAEWIQDISSYVWNEVYGYKYTGSYAILPYLVVKDGTEYEKYSMALDASFGKVKATSLDTGQGVNQLYAMNQDLETTDSPTFSTITINGDKGAALYTGSTQNLTDYPIGTMLLASSLLNYIRNASVSVGYTGDGGFIIGSGTSLSGTWRTRGAFMLTGSGGDYYVFLVQRVS